MLPACRRGVCWCEPYKRETVCWLQVFVSVHVSAACLVLYNKALHLGLVNALHLGLELSMSGELLSKTRTGNKKSSWK